MMSDVKHNKFQIGSKTIGVGEKTYVIAEAGNNHNGCFDRAIALVDAAKKAGADCVKFQMRRLDLVYRESSLSGADNDLSVEYTVDLLKRFELSTADQKKISEYCKSKSIEYLCTPWDHESANVLLSEFDVPAFKVSSADLTNVPLLSYLAKLGKPLIISTGMSRMFEIKHGVELLNLNNANFVVLHCQSTYPAAFHNINLNFMERLRELHPFVGYSGHERGVAVSHAAVALGAVVVERHITLDRNMEGPDHAASLEPDEFLELVSGIREIDSAMGKKLGADSERPMSQGELINRENLGKSLVAASAIKAGDIIGEDDVIVRSPGLGLSPLHYNDLVGKLALRSIEADSFFFESDISVGSRVSSRKYQFSRPWGVPVRYHDVDDFLNVSQPDFVEFHFSYQDMDRDPAEFMEREEYDIDFVVHAPELFKGSHLLDLATHDSDYRENSIREMQRVVDITVALNKFFPKTQRPMIVTNIGGISMDAPLSEDEKAVRYEIFADSLGQLNLEGVELIPQTMAPFPWHFGGQRYQNLFVRPEECARECKKLDLRMCVDVSHSALAANHLGFELDEIIKALSGRIAHLHIGDALGVDGEGLPIGDGSIDFESLGKALETHAPGTLFIPEIWQGHKNLGEGFWVALSKLEGKL